MDALTTMIAELTRSQAKAVEARLRQLLIAKGIDPDDRSPGWEDRARRALGDLELSDSVEWLDECRARITTTIRPKRGAPPLALLDTGR